MFLKFQEKAQIERYEFLLKIVGALSKLSSESDVPYLYYRMAEKIFCKSFDAEDLSRSDISIDAKKNNLGIGLKTFLHKNGSSVEKIAEFNKDRISFANCPSNEEIVRKISGLRNYRLNATGSITGVATDNMLYHCVTRTQSKMFVYETKMDLIDIEKIKNIKKKKDNIIYFDDEKNDYCFNLSKSTLFKRFNIDPIYKINSEIIEDPFLFLENCFKEYFDLKLGLETALNPIVSTILLPLYSYKDNNPYVYPKSGLNQWNAGGRERNYGEVYIQIPAEIHKKFPDFFRPRDESFTLKLPNGSSIKAKVCQQNSKALMSDPNKSLGDWILRDVLMLEEGELLTYKKLEDLGFDSVEINKYSDGTYEINVKSIGSYENFKSLYLS